MTTTAANLGSRACGGDPVAHLNWRGSPFSAILGFAIATFGVEMTISPSWAFCLDIGGTRAGAVSATMNMAGNFGGFVSTNAFPLLRRLTGGPAAYFQAAALLNLLSILCWFAMRSSRDAQPTPQRTSEPASAATGVPSHTTK